jgi:hypothetical protein
MRPLSIGSSLHHRSGDVVFISGNEVGADLAVAVVFESEALVDGAEAWAGADAIQTQVTETKRPSAFRGPTQKGCRQARTRIGSAHRQAMNVGCFLRADVGPEDWIIQLKLHRSNRISRVFREEEKTSTDIRGDGRGFEFGFSPTAACPLAPASGQPLGGCPRLLRCPEPWLGGFAFRRSFCGAGSFVSRFLGWEWSQERRALCDDWAKAGLSVGTDPPLPRKDGAPVKPFER